MEKINHKHLSDRLGILTKDIQYTFTYTYIFVNTCFQYFPARTYNTVFNR